MSSKNRYMFPQKPWQQEIRSEANISYRLLSFRSLLLIILGLMITIYGARFQKNSDVRGQETISLNSGIATPISSKKQHLPTSWAQLPLHFESHAGQNGHNYYLARGIGYSLAIEADGIIFIPEEKHVVDNTLTAIRMQFDDALVTSPMGRDLLPGKAHYLIGNQPELWRTNIPLYTSVQQSQLYPGIDIRYYGKQGQLEYDLIVAPGTDTSQIQFSFEGVDKLDVDDNGDLLLTTAQGILRQHKPHIYQQIANERTLIEGSYQLLANNQIGFRIQQYNHQYALVIDPILDYATYLGGNKGDYSTTIAVDNTGSVYVAGITKSVDFPVVNTLQQKHSGSTNVFIAKLSPDGSTLDYVTYLGGRGNGRKSKIGDAWDIAVDDSCQLHLIGTTHGNNAIPIVNAIQENNAGGRDAYIAKFSADGSELLFATYFGGNKHDEGLGIALDSANDIYITGITSSDNLPVANAFQDKRNKRKDAFVSKLSSDGRQLIYSTYLGGGGDEYSQAIAVNTEGQATIVGTTKSTTDFPLQNAMQEIYGGGGDVFVSQLSEEGSSLRFSTYLGGNRADRGQDIVFDSHGQAIVTGFTASDDFPVINAFQSQYGGKDDGFISQFSEDGSALLSSTYMGGNKSDILNSIAVDNNDNIYVAGSTRSTGLPIVDPIPMSNTSSPHAVDAYIAKFNNDLSEVIYSEYFGGDKKDIATAIAINKDDIYISGLTTSKHNFPLQNPLQPLFGGGHQSDAFIIKISSDNHDPKISSNPSREAIVNQIYSYLVEATDEDNDTLEYSLIQSPDDMIIDSTTGEIHWIPSSATNVDIQVQVDDGQGGTDEQRWTIDVSQANTPPIIESMPPLTAIVGSIYSYTVIANDADGDSLIYILNIAPAGMTIDNNGVISWIPTNIGNVPVQISVSDGQETTQQNWNIDTSIIVANNPPHISSIPVRTGAIDVTYHYTIIATDLDGDTLNYHLIQAPLGMNINSHTGEISWTPTDAGNDIVRVSVTDGKGGTDEQHWTVLIEYSSEFNPPSLEQIEDHTVTLGTMLNLQLQGSDIDGDILRYSIQPLPLPIGMTLNADTGEFIYRPMPEQAGVQTITFSVTDGRFTTTQAITITVPEIDPLSPTRMIGRVVDADALEQGIDLGIVGSTVQYLGDISGARAITDINGNFILENIPDDAEVFWINNTTAQAAPGGAGYASFRTEMPLIAHTDNIVKRPFSLPRLAMESMAQVNPAQTTTVNNPTLGVTMVVPPNTAVNEDGSQFTGELSISLVPKDLAPGQMPEWLDPSFLITIQPVGVSFSTPVPISFPNVDGLAPGEEVDIWSLDPETGMFAIVGRGRVTSNSQYIETISGGVIKADWHFPAPAPPSPDPTGPETKEPDNDCNSDSNVSEEGASGFGLYDGQVTTHFKLPAYHSQQVGRELQFNYSTFRAYPRPVIASNNKISRSSATPTLVSYSLEIGGIKQGQETFINTAEFSNFTDESFRTAIAFDASEMLSGMYDYRVKITSNFGVNGTGTQISRFDEGQITVVNDQKSAFGSGWLLNGLDKLAFNPDGSVTKLCSRGNTITYRPDNINSDTFISPGANYDRFERNADGSYLQITKTGIKRYFTSEGLISGYEDRNGNITQYRYSPDRRLDKMIDPVGLETIFSYNNYNLLDTVIDPAGRISRFEYDANANLTTVIYPDGSFITHEYDDRHLLVAHTDEEGNRSSDIYDVFGQIIYGTLPDGTVRAASGISSAGLVDVSSGIGTRENPIAATRYDEVLGFYRDGRGFGSSLKLDPYGRKIETTDAVDRITKNVRDVNSNATQTTRPNLSVINRIYDDNGNITSRTEQFNGAVTRYTYDNFSLLTSTTNPNNHTTTINRNIVTGNIESVANPLGHTSSRTYYSNGLIKQSTDANGLVVDYVYNAQQLPVIVTQTPPSDSPDNSRITRYSYYSTGLLKHITTPDNIILDYTYDDRSRPLTVTDNLGQFIRYTYDEYGNILQSDTRDPDGTLALTVSRTYDDRNRLFETIAPHSDSEDSIATQVLDPESNLRELIDPNGNSSTNIYDGVNRLTENSHRLDGITLYEYDTENRITKVTAPNGVITQYSYDVLGRKLTEDSPDRGHLSYSYDLANNITTITEGRGIDVIYDYDELERITLVTYPNTITDKDETIIYSYDTDDNGCTFGIGRLCRIEDESGITDYDYDIWGNIISQTHIELGVTYLTDYQYDAGNRTIQTTYPSGRMINITRDDVRRTQSIDATVNGITKTLVSEMQYRSDNQMTQGILGNGLIDQRSYDLQGRLAQQSLVTALDNIIDQRNYSYDKNGNILNIDTNLQDHNYQYDALDRLVQQIQANNSPTQYNYDFNDNRMARNILDLSVQSLYDYTPDTNQLQRTETLLDDSQTPITIPNRELAYNDAGRLYQLIEEGILKTDYIYNSQGQRTQKTSYDELGNPSTIIYHYSMGNLIEETDDNGKLNKSYIWNGMNLVAQINHNQGNEQLTYLTTDHLYTARIGTNDNQTINWRWQGEAFGNTKPQELAGIHINIRFPGQYYDQETNLFYNWNRYYDPSLGRYITSDPIGLAAGTDTYGYVSQNTLIGIDPKGLLKIHGNWCGPNWTGGREEQYWDDAPSNYYSPPVSFMDAKCKSHDICYDTCRYENKCNKKSRGECMTKCDRVLAEDTQIRSGGAFIGVSIGVYLWMKFNNLPDPGENDSSCPNCDNNE